MTKRELIDYCLTFPTAFEVYPFDETTAVIKHSGNNKMFALIDIMDGKLYINLKCDPTKADFLRNIYKSVTAGWHMNKFHWNTVYIDGDVSKEELFSMINDSYDLVKPKTKRAVQNMKCEWKKDEKKIYLPKQIPELLTIPKYKYFTIKGNGNPNGADFTDRIGVLYPLAYAVKMMPKKGFIPEGYFNYTVYPLEGIWDLSEKAKADSIFDKNELVYKIMIRQPDFVTHEVAEMALNQIIAKRDSSPLLEEVVFEEIEDGPSVQMLHIGSFDTESASFDMMNDFCRTNKLERHDLHHREIYISDFRKTPPEKLKTVLRYFVRYKTESEG